MIEDDERLEREAAAQERERRDKMFCTPCGRWVTPIRSAPAAPPMCPRCRSGRVRPPARGEVPG